MSRVKQIVRRLPACLAVWGLLGAAFLPPEHVHSGDDHGRHAEIVHRHFEPHDPVESSGPAIDHPDEHEALWIGSWFIVPTSQTHVPPLRPVLHGEPRIGVAPGSTRTTPPSTPESVHDPPWVSSYGLRAPPPLLV
jgi:hypothetical protein